MAAGGIRDPLGTRPVCRAAHIVSRLQSTNYLQSYMLLKISVTFSFLAKYSYSLHPIKLKLGIIVRL